MPRSVGVVGKPNVGKSTFFSAATLAPVEIANYPFTTIKPNKGIAYVRTPCACRDFNVKDEPGNSACVDGVRLIPVELIDCAGLVPGAWEGRGLGNQFLDEIRKADALIHVVDAAGATDIEGKPVTPGTHDPLEDVGFLDREITMWMAQILKKDWDKLVRRLETTGESFADALAEKLSGLGITRKYVLHAQKEAGLSSVKPTSWNREQFEKFVDGIRRVSKPMLVAANKIDVPEAEKNLDRLKEAQYLVVPTSAEAELALRRANEKSLISYVPGQSGFAISNRATLREEQAAALKRIKEHVLALWEGTGVQQSLDLAFFKLLGMITVYPVENADRLTDHKGRVLPDAYLVPFGTTVREFAYLIHTELGENFIHAIDVRSKMRVGENHVLKDRDVISIVSSAKRG